MNNHKEYQETLVRILTEPENDLENLARVAGQDPRTFYRGANFRDADLSGEKLDNFDLVNARLQKSANQSDRRSYSGFLDVPLGHSGKRVRMSTKMLVPLHELLLAANPRQLSDHLELAVYRNTTSLSTDDLKILMSRNLVVEAAATLSKIGVEFPSLEQRFAYTFSIEFRDRMYDLARRLNVSSGVALSRMIYFVFCYDEVSGADTISLQHVAKVNELGAMFSTALEAVREHQSQKP